MKAMILKKIGSFSENKAPLELANMPDPVPGETEILVRVSTCGVCHTELDEIEGRTPPNLPVIPGHQVIGRVEQTGRKASSFNIGDRVGIGWIHSSCGKCRFCMEGKENLCNEFHATGRDVNGGYAQYMTVPESFAFNIPDLFSDSEAAPLLCAGAIGYRSIKLTGIRDGQNLGLTGFGASAHLVLQMARHSFPKSQIFVFARSENERKFARELGAVWSGAAEENSPEKLDCIIDTTPVWKPIIDALKNLKPGGRLVINAIRKEEIDKEYLLKLDYPTHLWMEKEVKSVANVSRSDISEFIKLAAEIPIKPEVQEFELEDANEALAELKAKKIRGAKVLIID
ncbi:MAG: putative alcohol dehydrogenase AdhA [Candidatus Scalindua arabica]|uniref:Alcohol dehydrogenase AdhA n=1 Tax=Candidatus Scalindua arabica TaxID=1127984 RepID=A0A941W1S4_9BACT|nr:putative alcohol dehydrogenase AdhA [Candidatus Scalindua arabica]